MSKPGDPVPAVARLVLGLAVGRIAAEREDVADAEVMVIHQLVLDLGGGQIAASEMRDARDADKKRRREEGSRIPKRHDINPCSMANREDAPRLLSNSTAAGGSRAA